MTSCGKDSCACKSCGRVLCMSRIPLLSNLDEFELEKISDGVITKDYKKGQAIFNSGDRADRLYIVCDGSIKVIKNSVDGKEQILYILSQGDFIGAFNLLKEDEFEFSAIALANVRVSTLAKEEFNKIILKNPTITLKVLEKAYERINKVEQLVDRLSANSVDAKVSALLLNLVKDHGIISEKGIMLELSINREEMGSLSGISRETMTRKLKLFEELGIIELVGNKKIIVKKLSELRGLS